MSLMARMRVRNLWASLAEVLLLFPLVSAAYFFLVTFLYVAAHSFLAHLFDWPATHSVLAVSRWPGALPVWMWFVEGLGWVFLVIFYWTPADEATNETELRAFAVACAVLILLGGAFLQVKYKAISGAARIFWENVNEEKQEGGKSQRESA